MMRIAERESLRPTYAIYLDKTKNKWCAEIWHDDELVKQVYRLTAPCCRQWVNMYFFKRD